MCLEFRENRAGDFGVFPWKIFNCSMAAELGALDPGMWLCFDSSCPRQCDLWEITPWPGVLLWRASKSHLWGMGPLPRCQEASPFFLRTLSPTPPFFMGLPIYFPSWYSFSTKDGLQVWNTERDSAREEIQVYSLINYLSCTVTCLLLLIISLGNVHNSRSEAKR